MGILLFLPVPAVLWLYTRLPLGVLPSLGLGAALMVTHPLYARPFALRRAGRRCLWCGGAASAPPSKENGLFLQEPRGLTPWLACREAHREKVIRVLAWAERRSRFLRAGILGALFVFLVWTLLAAVNLGGLRRPGHLAARDAVAFFRLAVALTVLPLSLLGPRSRRPDREPIRTPFPVHIQALIGTWAVLWLFRLIGLLWLIQGSAHFIRLCLRRW